MKKILFLALCLAIPGLAYSGGNSQGAIGATATSVLVGPNLVTTQGLTFNNPHEVHLMRVTCAGGKWIQAQVADCCIKGDKWSIEIDVKDGLPNRGVTMASGTPGSYSAPARVLTFGKSVDALVKVSYPHGGIALWPAGLTVKFTTAAACTPIVTLLPKEYN